MDKLLVILGSTSTGKTDLALKFAHKFKGELVSVDSRQVYINLDIGTGKLPGYEVTVKRSAGFWEINEVRVWMYDVADPRNQYTVYDYVKDASKIINDIARRGKLPILAGGTGFYLRALLEGLPNLEVPVNQKLRKQLDKLTIQQLQQRLQEVSCGKWSKMNDSDKQNPRRLIRAIEIASTDFTSEESLRVTIRGGFKTLKIGLAAPREILYQRIDERVKSRIEQGMIDEAKRLHNEGLSFERMKQLGLEYGVLADYLMGKIASKDELIKILQNKIHGFARRQITWFKKDKDANWFDITDPNYLHKVEELVNEWYDRAI